MRGLKYYAHLQIWIPLIIICSFIVIYHNVIEKKTIWKIRTFLHYTYFYWHPQNWSIILKNYYCCLFKINKFQIDLQVIGKTFSTPLLKTKHATSENPNNIALKISPKTNFRKLNETRFLVWVSSQITFTEKRKKACVAVLLRSN